MNMFGNTGFETVSEETAQEMKTGTTTEAAAAIEQGFQDEGPETNPSQGQNSVGERPAEDEPLEQLGEADNTPPASDGEPETVADEPGVEIDIDKDPETGELYTVTVQGETRQVSLDDLQSGYMLQADYTKKTQTLADERRFINEQAQAVNAERQQYVTLLTSLEQQLNTGGEQEPDWVELSRTDPVGYTRQKAAWEQRQSILNAAKIERERVEGLQHQDFQRQAAEHGQRQRELIVQAKPELADPEKANAYQQNLRTYATETFGFTDQELASITDHRQALILEKAMLYDQAVRKGGVVQQKLKTQGPKAIIRPGAARGTEVVRERTNQKAQDRFDRTGDVNDAARLMENFV
jgi:hypothetical protein